MGAPNIALDSFLVSPKPEMDLKRGVSGKIGSVKDAKADKGFEHLLMSKTEAKVPHESAHAKTNVKDSKDIRKDAKDAKVARDGDAPEQTSKDVQPAADQEGTADTENSVNAEVQPNQPEEASDPTAKDGDATLMQVMLASQEALRAQILKPLENDQTLKLSENEKISAAQLADAGASENVNPLQWMKTQQTTPSELKVAADTLSKVPSQPNNNMDQTKSAITKDSAILDASAKLEQNAVLDVKLAGDSGESFNARSDSQSVGLPDLSAQKDVSGKSLKHLVDSLFVQQSLDAQSNGASPQLLSSVKGDVTLNSQVAPETVRSHLLNDIQPVIHKMVMQDQGGEMTVSLRPGHLGWVKVNVQVDEGAVKIALQTETSQAKSLLEGQMKDLHESLNQSGLKVNGVSVAVSPSASSQHQPEMNDGNNPQNPQRDSENARREQSDSRQPASQQRSMDELFAEMMNERNAA